MPWDGRGQMVEDYGLDEAAAYGVAFYLDSFYRQHGYTQAVTTPRIKGPWELELCVQEGPLAHVGHVLIEENAAFDSGKIEDYLLGPIRERFPRARRDTDLPLVESDIFQGADLVRRFYVAEGYLDAIVEPPTIVLDDTAKSGSITLTVHEGPGYRFGNIRFEGPAPLTTGRMLSEISSQTGGGFTPGRLAAARRALQDLYVADGYFLAEVTAQASLESAQNGVVPVVFSISPGAIHHFQGMTVKGTRRLKDSFLQKRFGHLAGRRYDPSAVNKTFRELMQTGLFRNLQIDPVARGAEEIELQVRVEEANPKEFSLALGYASFYGGSVSLAYSDRNLFGNGRPAPFCRPNLSA
ncbi:MAG: POTRA domain-containing protein [Terrimicrobiaceae bacterium]